MRPFYLARPCAHVDLNCCTLLSPESLVIPMARTVHCNRARSTSSLFFQSSDSSTVFFFWINAQIATENCSVYQIRPKSDALRIFTNLTHPNSRNRHFPKILHEFATFQGASAHDHDNLRTPSPISPLFQVPNCIHHKFQHRLPRSPQIRCTVTESPLLYRIVV